MRQRDIVNGMFHTKICQFRGLKHCGIQQQTFLGTHIRIGILILSERFRIQQINAASQRYILPVQQKCRNELIKEILFLIRKANLPIPSFGILGNRLSGKYPILITCRMEQIKISVITCRYLWHLYRILQFFRRIFII